MMAALSPTSPRAWSMSLPISSVTGRANSSTRARIMAAAFAATAARSANVVCRQVSKQVAVRWRDSPHGNEQKLLTLSLDEFLRRFLLHVLPKGFVRIRNFGFLANRRRATLLPLCFHLLGSAPQAEQDISSSKTPSDLWLCPKCGGPMMVIERLTAAEIQLRSPPALVTEAA